MNFGEAAPTRPDDGEYALRVLDLDQPPTAPPHDLDPFSSIAPIDHDLNQCLQHMRQNSKKQFVLAIVTRNLTPPQIGQMVQNHLRNLPNVHMLHLFFTNGRQVQNTWRSRYSPLVQSCRSITANLSSDLRAVCNEFCSHNIAFCTDRAQEYDRLTEKSIANGFRIQQFNYADLMYRYTLRQLNDCSSIEV